MSNISVQGSSSGRLCKACRNSPRARELGKTSGLSGVSCLLGRMAGSSWQCCSSECLCLPKRAYGAAENKRVVTWWPAADHHASATVCFDYWGSEAESLLFLLRAGLDWDSSSLYTQSGSQIAFYRRAEPQYHGINAQERPGSNTTPWLWLPGTASMGRR